jgi:Phage tail tube protein
MPFGSGLSAQLGVANETTWGTPVTVTKFYELLNESVHHEPTWLDSTGLKTGVAFTRASRVVQSRVDVNGEIVIEHADRGAASGGGMGQWWKHALGSTITTRTVIATTAYRQTHVPGPKTGFGQTIQVGRPQTDGTVKAFTYEGCKISQWEFTCSDNEIARLSLTISGQQELTATALAAASFPTGVGVFSFADASTFTIGGTPTTSAGRTTIAGGTPITTIARGITLTGATPMATERYGLGNAGLKQQPIENDTATITGTLDAEFTSQAETYDLFKANTTTALQLDFSHGDAGSGNPYRLSFIMPAVKFKAATVNVDGPDLIPQSIEFQAYDDGTTNPVIQVELVELANTAL